MTQSFSISQIIELRCIIELDAQVVVVEKC